MVSVVDVVGLMVSPLDQMDNTFNHTNYWGLPLLWEGVALCMARLPLAHSGCWARSLIDWVSLWVPRPPAQNCHSGKDTTGDFLLLIWPNQ